MTSVFISHSSLDKPFVRRLERALRKAGVSVWVDDRQIKVGHKISSRIEEGIEKSDYFLLVVSRHAVQSAWVKEELDSAHFTAVKNRRDSILPVLVDNVQLPARLRGYRYADFRRSFQEGKKELMKAFKIDEEYVATLSEGARHQLIEQLLRTTDSLGDLPAGVTALTQNTSDLRLFEEKLNTQTPRTVLYNAVDAIGRLADPEYDGRRIRYYTSIGPLADLYENSADEGLREEIVGAIGPIGSKFCYDHLVRWLPGASPRIKAAILRELWRCYGSDSFTPIPWHDTLIKLLHKYTTWSDKDCLYLDLEFGENDFRFWVFRCLGVARKRSSKPYILRFLGTKTWPFAVVAEAAAAHWEITRSDKYVGVLRKADRLGVACGASVTLRTYQGISEVNQRQEIEDGWSAINSLTPNGA